MIWVSRSEIGSLQTQQSLNTVTMENKMRIQKLKFHCLGKIELFQKTKNNDKIFIDDFIQTMKNEKITLEDEDILRQRFKERTHIEVIKLHEKFYRYAYNLNLEKCEKYHSKINDASLEVLNQSMNGEKKLVMLDKSSIIENDEAIRQYSEMISCHYKDRENIIEALKKVNQK